MTIKFRFAKDSAGKLVVCGVDENQSGEYTTNVTWCSWVVDSVPSCQKGKHFEENATADGYIVVDDE